MPRPVSIAALCRRQRNEDVHTAYVAALARGLFETARRRRWVDAADWRLLEAACLLHDVGYAREPLRHAEESVRQIRAAPLEGFTREERLAVAAVAGLHAPDGPPAPAGLGADGRRWRRLGAILRAADGLDHGHVQNASLLGVRRRGGRLEAVVETSAHPANVARANAKADLWNAVMPAPILFVAARRPGGRAPLCDPGGSLYETIRRLAAVYLRAVRDGAARAAGGDPEALHDLRVALRRLRVLLEAAAPALRGTRAAAVRRDIRRLARALGPARDADVWVAFLRGDKIRRRFERDPAWPGLCRAAETAARRARRGLAAEVRGPAWDRLRARAGRLSRVDLAGLARGDSGPRAAPFAADALARALRRLRRASDRAASPDEAELHAFRRRLRAARHLCELFADVLGPDVEEAAAALRKADRPLGRVHDLDVILARPVPRAPGELGEFLRARRARQLRLFRARWKRLRPRLRALRKALRRPHA